LARRSAIAKVAVVSVMAVLIAAGAVGLYFYTSTPTPMLTSSATSSISSSAGGTSSVATAPDGYQSADGLPHGSWANYLGYLPLGYTPAPHYPGGATYSCPPGMDAAQCKLFQASCGNGVCDPNESCATCPFDCGVPGQLTCDPYTGRPGAPASICQAGPLGG